MEPKRKKRNEASGERAVEKPLPGKVQNQDFSTSLGNPPNPRISTFPQPRRRRLVIFYLEAWRTKTPNPTSSEINLSQAKNGLDDGVHLTQIAGHLLAATKAVRGADDQHESQRRNRPNSRMCHQSFHLWNSLGFLFDRLAQFIDVGIELV